MNRTAQSETRGSVREWLVRTHRSIFPVQLFVRFSAFGGSAVLPLLGAVTVSPQIPLEQMLGLIAVSVTFHLFAYVLNDVIDLSIDRTEPRRAEFPLVRGIIQPWQALIFALFQIPMAFTLTARLGPTLSAYGALSLAFVLMTVYNLWGKRASFPFMTDAIQGFAWGLLVTFGGAVVLAVLPNFLTGVVVAYIVIFIMLANGVHGSLRDLENDLACGVRSTAIVLGARPPQGGERPIIPTGLKLYAFSLQIILIVLTLIPLGRNDFGYGPVAWTVTTITIVILAIISLCLLAVAGAAGSHQEMLAAGMLQLILSLSSLLVLFGFFVASGVLIVMLTVYCLPLLTHRWLYDALRWSGQWVTAWLARA